LFLGHLEPADACIGALLGSGLLGGLRYLSHGGLGLGDVKLAVPLGAWLGWEDLLLCLLLASVTGLVYGAWLFVCRRLNRHTPLPFGPFLALYRAAIISFHVFRLTMWQLFVQDIQKRAVKVIDYLLPILSINPYICN
jgi:prepilin signal peptidase PulO-like enzyme (type II secretory pathway)